MPRRILFLESLNGLEISDLDSTKISEVFKVDLFQWFEMAIWQAVVRLLFAVMNGVECDWMQVIVDWYQFSVVMVVWLELLICFSYL